VLQRESGSPPSARPKKLHFKLMLKRRPRTPDKVSLQKHFEPIAAMLYQVEIRLVEDSILSERMEAMRLWLDERHFEPTTFRYAFAHQAIVFRVDFPIELEAAEFAIAFDGKLVGNGSPMAI
jgi:hypothetical protein